ASLREATNLLIAGRDDPEQRAKAQAAQALAASLPVPRTTATQASTSLIGASSVQADDRSAAAPEASRIRERRLRALIALADGSTGAADELSADDGLLDRCHLAAAA